VVDLEAIANISNMVSCVASLRLSSDATRRRISKLKKMPNASKIADAFKMSIRNTERMSTALSYKSQPLIRQARAE
jgi:hypothetical protein